MPSLEIYKRLTLLAVYLDCLSSSVSISYLSLHLSLCCWCCSGVITALLHLSYSLRLANLFNKVLTDIQMYVTDINGQASL